MRLYSDMDLYLNVLYSILRPPMILHIFHKISI